MVLALVLVELVAGYVLVIPSAVVDVVPAASSSFATLPVVALLVAGYVLVILPAVADVDAVPIAS